MSRKDFFANALPQSKHIKRVIKGRRQKADFSRMGTRTQALPDLGAGELKLAELRTP